MHTSTNSRLSLLLPRQLAEYVRQRVKSGRYGSASEVVGDALRRMEEEDQRTLRLAAPAADDLLADLDGQQLEGIRARVQASIAAIEAGDFRDYDDNDGLLALAQGVKSRGRKRLGAG